MVALMETTCFNVIALEPPKPTCSKCSFTKAGGGEKRAGDLTRYTSVKCAVNKKAQANPPRFSFQLMLLVMNTIRLAFRKRLLAICTRSRNQTKHLKNKSKRERLDAAHYKVKKRLISPSTV